LPDRTSSPRGGDTVEVQPLQTGKHRFSVDGTRPVLEFEISSGKAEEGGGEAEKLTIEIHTPISGEVFEARTSMGRLEVDRDGRVMYFSQAADSVSFTLFVGRSVVVTMSRRSGEVIVETPSRILSVDHRSEGGGAKGLGTSATTGSVRIQLE
jgi:hypothetical protein